MVEKTQENTTFIINETSKACSFECGKAGNRFKVYYDTVKNLKAHLAELETAKLYSKE